MNQDKNFFSLRLIQSCPVCNGEFRQNSLQILDEAENDFLVHVTCQKCLSKILVRVSITPHGIVGNALLTDLFPDEVTLYGQDKQVDANYVLAVHEFLSKSNRL